MQLVSLYPLSLLHRHIGGLEIIKMVEIDTDFLHRHIGGLEKNKARNEGFTFLHRHIGGLESYRVLERKHLDPSPPHRRLRKSIRIKVSRSNSSPPHRRLRK